MYASIQQKKQTTTVYRANRIRYIENLHNIQNNKENSKYATHTLNACLGKIITMKTLKIMPLACLIDTWKKYYKKKIQK
jgi:hypothetical protein